MANQAEKPKKTVSEGAFRHYVFSGPELRGEVERFLRQVGYETKPTAYVGLVQPDFRARRKTDGAIYEILGLVRDKFDQAVEALTRLAAMRAVKPDADCVLVLPPINEYLLIEFLMEEIRTLQGYGAREIKLSDENFTSNREYAIAFCKAVCEAGMKLSFELMNASRADEADPEVLRWMKRAGWHRPARLRRG